MRYKTKQNLWVLAFVLVVALNAVLFYRPTETAKMITEPGETCPEDTFYIPEDKTCVPFRNDHQKYLYEHRDVAGSTPLYEKEN